MSSKSFPRLVIGGLSGDSGKTVLTCGLIAYFKDKGMKISAFKKGPDYIDTAWLSSVTEQPARNLDTYLMGFPVVKRSFINNASGSRLSIIEGNRGIFDGVDSRGTHSTAELAKLLRAPLIIIQNLSKVTRTAAATILGCKELDPDLNIAGVILNQVAGERHAKIAKESIEDITGIPVLGTIPKLSDRYRLPSRHLGLITPGEYKSRANIIVDLKKVVEDNIDIDRVLNIATNVPLLESIELISPDDEIIKSEDIVKIGYFRDQSFSFYYPENLEMLSKAGAELIPISPVKENELEDLDAVYIGGGFPETNLTKLSLNKYLMESLKDLVEDGLPVYAECGGLMYLSRDVEWKDSKYLLSGILPISIKMHEKPQGHGYCEAKVDSENPFYKIGSVISGHEFHYSKIYNHDEDLRSSFRVLRGTGCFNGRDGLTYKNVFASYFHVHALATPEWVNGMINSAKNYSELKKSKTLIEG